MAITQAQGGFQDQSAIFNQGMAILGQGAMAFGNKMQQRRRDENQEITSKVDNIIDQYDMGGLYLTNPQLADDYSKRMGVDISIYKNTADTLSKQGLTPGSLEFQNAFSALTPWNKDKAAAFSRDVMQLGIGGGQKQQQVQPQGQGQVPQQVQSQVREVPQEQPIKQAPLYQGPNIAQPQQAIPQSGIAVDGSNISSSIDQLEQHKSQMQQFPVSNAIHSLNFLNDRVSEAKSTLDAAGQNIMKANISTGTSKLVDNSGLTITKNPQEAVGINAPIGITETSLGKFNPFSPDEWANIRKIPLEGNKRLDAMVGALQGKGLGAGIEKGGGTLQGVKLDALQGRMVRQQLFANGLSDDPDRPADAVTNGWWNTNIDKTVGMDGFEGTVETQGKVRDQEDTSGTISGPIMKLLTKSANTEGGEKEALKGEISQTFEKADSQIAQDALDNPDKVNPELLKPIDSDNLFALAIDLITHDPQRASLIFPNTMKAYTEVQEAGGNAQLAQARAREATQNLKMKEKLYLTIGEQKIIDMQIDEMKNKSKLQGMQLEIAKIGYEEAILKNAMLDKQLEAMGVPKTPEGITDMFNVLLKNKERSEREEIMFNILYDYIRSGTGLVSPEELGWVENINRPGWDLPQDFFRGTQSGFVTGDPALTIPKPTSTVPTSGNDSNALELYYRNHPDQRP